MANQELTYHKLPQTNKIDMSARTATHAGSWYTANSKQLNSELSGWIAQVDGPNSSSGYAPPIKDCKAIIAPHAGYSYSGPTAAWAYKSIDVTKVRRVFILGPSHHVYLDGCALSLCKTYKTPIGDLPLDLETIGKLRATGEFADMDIQTDEDEHSIEMHLPYVRKMFESQDIVVIPILVGAISYQKERHFGDLLAPYLAEEDTFFVVSSDFCHWGIRFSYTFYYPTPPPGGQATAVRLKASNVSTSLKSATHPIHASITALDHEAMEILALEPTPDTKTAEAAHSQFDTYLKRTKNTICGRHPIGVLLGALTGVQEMGGGNVLPTLRWVRYAQSSACENLRDSSVSYASAYITL
ncbi:UPF0103-domain-containing protein [Clavulina sp. PMI_390]|nr:UPF0103-domain-containing protein [Clavulina sp. PMI_390]